MGDKESVSSWVIMVEDAGGATEMGPGWREVGPEERLDGHVARRAISRPSSVTRPWSSVIPSLISRRSCTGTGPPPDGGDFSFSFSLSTNHRSTSLIRSSNARTCPTVHFSSFSNRLTMVRSVPGMSRVPWALNWA